MSKTKKKKKKAATKKRAPAKPKDNSTEIVFSHGEIDFLRKITGKDADGSTPKNRRARLSLRDKLLELSFGAPDAFSGLIVLELFRPEVEFLQRTTKEVYSFITAEERRARLISSRENPDRRRESDGQEGSSGVGALAPWGPGP